MLRNEEEQEVILPRGGAIQHNDYQNKNDIPSSLSSPIHRPRGGEAEKSSGGKKRKKLKKLAKKIFIYPKLKEQQQEDVSSSNDEDSSDNITPTSTPTKVVDLNSPVFLRRRQSFPSSISNHDSIRKQRQPKTNRSFDDSTSSDYNLMDDYHDEDLHPDTISIHDDDDDKNINVSSLSLGMMIHGDSLETHNDKDTRSNDETPPPTTLNSNLSCGQHMIQLYQESMTYYKIAMIQMKSHQIYEAKLNFHKCLKARQHLYGPTCVESVDIYLKLSDLLWSDEWDFSTDLDTNAVLDVGRTSNENDQERLNNNNNNADGITTNINHRFEIMEEILYYLNSALEIVQQQNQSQYRRSIQVDLSSHVQLLFKRAKVCVHMVVSTTTMTTECNGTRLAKLQLSTAAVVDADAGAGTSDHYDGAHHTSGLLLQAYKDIETVLDFILLQSPLSSVSVSPEETNNDNKSRSIQLPVDTLFGHNQGQSTLLYIGLLLVIIGRLDIERQSTQEDSSSYSIREAETSLKLAFKLPFLSYSLKMEALYWLGYIHETHYGNFLKACEYYQNSLFVAVDENDKKHDAEDQEEEDDDDDDDDDDGQEDALSTSTTMQTMITMRHLAFCLFQLDDYEQSYQAYKETILFMAQDVIHIAKTMTEASSGGTTTSVSCCDTIPTVLSNITQKLMDIFEVVDNIEYLLKKWHSHTNMFVVWEEMSKIYETNLLKKISMHSTFQHPIFYTILTEQTTGSSSSSSLGIHNYTLLVLKRLGHYQYSMANNATFDFKKSFNYQPRREFDYYCEKAIHTFKTECKFREQNIMGNNNNNGNHQRRKLHLCKLVQQMASNLMMETTSSSVSSSSSSYNENHQLDTMNDLSSSYLSSSISDTTTTMMIVNKAEQYYREALCLILPFSSYLPNNKDDTNNDPFSSMILDSSSNSSSDQTSSSSSSSFLLPLMMQDNDNHIHRTSDETNSDQTFWIIQPKWLLECYRELIKTQQHYNEESLEEEKGNVEDKHPYCEIEYSFAMSCSSNRSNNISLEETAESSCSLFTFLDFVQTLTHLGNIYIMKQQAKEALICFESILVAFNEDENRLLSDVASNKTMTNSKFYSRSDSVIDQQQEEWLAAQYGRARALGLLHSYDEARQVLDLVISYRRQKQPLNKLALAYALNELGNLHLLLSSNHRNDCRRPSSTTNHANEHTTPSSYNQNDLYETAAIRCYEESAHLKRDVLGESHPYVIGTQQNYAMCLAKYKHYHLALCVLQDRVLRVLRHQRQQQQQQIRHFEDGKTSACECRTLDLHIAKVLELMSHICMKTTAATSTPGSGGSDMSANLVTNTDRNPNLSIAIQQALSYSQQSLELYQRHLEETNELILSNRLSLATCLAQAGNYRDAVIQCDIVKETLSNSREGMNNVNDIENQLKRTQRKIMQLQRQTTMNNNKQGLNMSSLVGTWFNDTMINCVWRKRRSSSTTVSSSFEPIPSVR